jgi:hypothetical protein
MGLTQEDPLAGLRGAFWLKVGDGLYWGQRGRMTPRIGADEGDLDEARIADGLDVRARRAAAEHTLHTYLPYPRKTKEPCGSQRVAGFRFTIFSPPALPLRGILYRATRHLPSPRNLVVAAHARPNPFIAAGAVGAGSPSRMASKTTFDG